MFATAYWWARSFNVVAIKCFTPSLFTTSSTSSHYSFASQTRQSTTSNLCKYFIMNPRHSFFMYPPAIEASVLTMFWIYYFNVFMYLLIGYIHVEDTCLHMSNSSTRWYTKCVRISKIGRGKWIFTSAMLRAMFACSGWNNVLPHASAYITKHIANSHDCLSSSWLSKTA